MPCSYELTLTLPKVAYICSRLDKKDDDGGDVDWQNVPTSFATCKRQHRFLLEEMASMQRCIDVALRDLRDPTSIAKRAVMPYQMPLACKNYLDPNQAASFASTSTSTSSNTAASSKTAASTSSNIAAALKTNMKTMSVGDETDTAAPATSSSSSSSASSLTPTSTSTSPSLVEGGQAQQQQQQQQQQDQRQQQVQEQDQVQEQEQDQEQGQVVDDVSAQAAAAERWAAAATPLKT